MRGQGNRRGQKRPTSGPQGAPYLGSGTVSILSKDFGIKGSLNVSSTIKTSSITVSTINLIDTDTAISSSFYLNNNLLYLDKDRIVALTDPDVSLSTLTAGIINVSSINAGTITSTIKLIDEGTSYPTSFYLNNNLLYLDEDRIVALTDPDVSLSTLTAGIVNASTINGESIFTSTIFAQSTVTTDLRFESDYNPYNLYVSTLGTYADTQTFTTTSTYTVPNYIKSVHVKIWGAGGGYFGNGAYIEGDLDVVPGETLDIIPGGAGGQGGDAAGGTSGTNGSGGDAGPYGSGGGGGASQILRGDTQLVVAGGGGSATVHQILTSSGSHAGITEGIGGDGYNGTSGGEGGTETEGGAAGDSDPPGDSDATAGSQASGGNGDSSGASTGEGGGGGGGGYYGGGGGGPSAGGGGGSSFIANLKNVVTYDGSESLLYQLISGYQQGIALGGGINDSDFSPTTPSGDGLIIISYNNADLVIDPADEKANLLTNNILTQSTITTRATFTNPYNEYSMYVSTLENPRDTIVFSQEAYSNGLTSFTVPLGVRLLDIKVWGAGGGYYGNGAYIEGQLKVVPGQQVNVVVGEGGLAVSNPPGWENNANPQNGSSKGGDGNLPYMGGAGGGTLSGIYDENDVPLVIAGAGGAASYGIQNSADANGDFCHGGAQGSPGNGQGGGGGGNQSAAGSGGQVTQPSNDAGDGNSGYGKNGGGGGDSSTGLGGGGAGDGFFGGGGGAGENDTGSGNGGGGGSSYISDSLINTSTIGGYASSSYQTIPGYITGVGIGGTYNGTDGNINTVTPVTTNGGHGLVIISYKRTDLIIESYDPTSRVICDNIKANSSIADVVTFNAPRPFNMFATGVPKNVFSYTGDDQTFIVPSGVTRIFVKLWGAAGNLGGYGAFVSGYINLEANGILPGDTLTIVTGGHGTDDGTSAYGGGGPGLINDDYDGNGYGCGGGGCSVILHNGTPIVISGGGGGGDNGSYQTFGGWGGIYTGFSGLVGQPGLANTGGGGTQTTGGEGGYADNTAANPTVVGSSGTSGSSYIYDETGGSSGGTGSKITSGAFNGYPGGGGGGGYYGGGGGGGAPPGGDTPGGAGGGGSSYIDNLTNIYCLDGSQFQKYVQDNDYQDNAGTSNGLIVITYPVNLQMQYTDPLTEIVVTQAPYTTPGFIAGGGDSSGDPTASLQYSIDGSNWSKIASGGFTDGAANNYAYGVAYNNSYWVAVGPTYNNSYWDVIDNVSTYIEEYELKSSIQTSFDGINWTSVNSGGFAEAFGVTYGSNTWVAVGSAPGRSTIQTSKDGSNWVPTSNAFLTSSFGIAFNSNTWVAVGQDSVDSRTIKYTRNLSNWSNAASGGFDVQGNGVAGITNMWVAVGESSTRSNIQYSGDASNWSNVITGSFATAGYGVYYGNNIWVAVGDTATFGGDPLETIQWSSDGSNWNLANSGGFTFAGYSVSFNGKLWNATGFADNIINSIQWSSDGSNWYSAVTLTNTISYCVASGLIVQNEFLQLTTLTNKTVSTSNFIGIEADMATLNADMISSGQIVSGQGLISELNASSFTTSDANIGDFYVYSYTDSFAVRTSETGNSFFVAAGTSIDPLNSLQWSIDGSNWYPAVSGGFTPSIDYSSERITNTTKPKALLYNTDTSNFIAYGITEDLTSSIQISSDGQNWTTSTTSISLTILSNLNSAHYITSNSLSNQSATNGIYLLLTSLENNAILASSNANPGLFDIITNEVNYWEDFTYTNTYATSSLTAAYGACTVGTSTFVVGMAQNNGSPIIHTVDGSNFVSTTSQPLPSLNSITFDSNTSTFWVAGPGIYNGSKYLSTVMFTSTLSSGNVTWIDANLPNTMGATSISHGSNPSMGTGSNIVLVTAQSSNSSNTIQEFFYKNNAYTNPPFIPNSLTNSTNTLLWSDDGYTFTPSKNGGFDVEGNDVAYNGSRYVAVGESQTTSTIQYSLNGSNWSNAGISTFSEAGYGVTAYSNGFLAVGKSSGPTILYSPNASNFTPSASGQGHFDIAGYGVTTDNISFAVAVGQSMTTSTILWYDGTNTWSNASKGSFDTVGYGVGYGDSMYIAVGKSTSTSNIVYSGDGSNWSNAVKGGFDRAGYGVAYNGTDMWVAVGESITTSSIQYSGDGSNWSNAGGIMFSVAGYGVSYFNNTVISSFVAVGESNTILYSVDGITWGQSQQSFNEIVGPTGTRNEYSVGNGVGGSDQRIIAAGAANITNSSNKWRGANSGGFRSAIDASGKYLQQTNLGTASLYDPVGEQFLVGGLTNDPDTSIVRNNTAQPNNWIPSISGNFDAVNELQFVNSINRSIIAADIRSSNIFSSTLTVSGTSYLPIVYSSSITVSTIVSNNINSQLLSASTTTTTILFASNAITSNIYTSTLTASTMSNVVLNNHIINTSSIVASNVDMTSGSATDFNITNLTVAFINGDGVGLSNVQPRTLVDIGPTNAYHIEHTDVYASTFHGAFNGTFNGTVAASSTTADNFTATNFITSQGTITANGNITTTGGQFIGNGAGLSNITANTLLNNTSYNIGTGIFTATRFNGNGVGLSNVTAVHATTATTATSATSATTAATANYASNAKYAVNAPPSGFVSFGEVGAFQGFRLYNQDRATLCLINNAGMGINGNISCGGQITANTFVGDGSRLTGIKSGLTEGSDIRVGSIQANGNLNVTGSITGQILATNGPYRSAQSWGANRIPLGEGTGNPADLGQQYYDLSDATIPINKDSVAIYDILVYTLPTGTIPSYHYMKALVRSPDAYQPQGSITVISDIAFAGSDANGNGWLEGFGAVRPPGANLITPPTRLTDGIYFVKNNSKYLLRFQTPNYYNGGYGIAATIQQVV